MAAASHGRLKECNQTRLLSVFFGLIKLAIYWYICILLRKKPYSSKVFWSLTSRKREKSVASLWGHEICCDTMRLTTKSWDLASLSGRTKPITAHENENCDWFVVLLIPRPCNLKNVVFISRTYTLVVRRSGELEEMLTPLLLILQLHFISDIWFSPGHKHPYNSLFMKTSLQRRAARKVPSWRSP